MSSCIRTPFLLLWLAAVACMCPLSNTVSPSLALTRTRESKREGGLSNWRSISPRHHTMAVNFHIDGELRQTVDLYRPLQPMQLHLSVWTTTGALLTEALHACVRTHWTGRHA